MLSDKHNFLTAKKLYYIFFFKLSVPDVRDPQLCHRRDQHIPHRLLPGRQIHAVSHPNFWVHAVSHPIYWVHAVSHPNYGIHAVSHPNC